MAQSTFERAVSTFRTSIRRRLNRHGRVSAADLNTVGKTVVGQTRGAAVREAFRQLSKEGVIVATDERVMNPRNRHKVAVYTRA